MNCNLLLCFVWINFISIQAFRKNNNVDLRRLIKYIHRKKYVTPLNDEAQENPPTKYIDFDENTYKKDDKRYYALVRTDIVNGKPAPKKKGRELTYHGNGKYGTRLRSGKKYNYPEILRVSYSDLIGEGNKIKPEKRALVSYEELTGRVDDAVEFQDNKKLNPGSSLLQLSGNDLASAAKFPVTEKSSLVYGNLDNLGITYGKTNNRLEYSSFRKFNDRMDMFDTSIPDSGPKKWIVLKITPNKLPNYFFELLKPTTEEEEEENNANEIMDEFDTSDETDRDLRRNSENSKYRKREPYNDDWKSDDGNSSSSGSSSSSSSSSGSSSETNSGNPYTLFKGKYRQNWMWKHDMDGDHMNINPYSPLFNDMGATGQDLYFGRKWWYFNQDDYKPMG